MSLFVLVLSLIPIAINICYAVGYYSTLSAHVWAYKSP